MRPKLELSYDALVVDAFQYCHELVALDIGSWNEANGVTSSLIVACHGLQLTGQGFVAETSPCFRFDCD